MFESAELGHKIDKAVYEREVPKLREALLEAQYALLESKEFPVVLVIGGVDGAGKGETVNLLNEWLDPRHVETTAFGPPSDEERERPAMWRYWRALPPRGKIGILFGSWYSDPIIDRVSRRIGKADLERSVEEIVRFERMLFDEGSLILKFWFHLSKERQRERLDALQKNPATRWRVTETDWQRFALYDKFRRVCDGVLRRSSRAEAPWTVVEGYDARYRGLTVGTLLLDALRNRVGAKPSAPPRVHPPPPIEPLDRVDVLGTLDLSQKLDKERYETRLERLQGKINRQSRNPKFRDMAVVVAFEGPDAAGKGGCIRRLTAALDARQYRIVSIAAPSEEERMQPYLWRFWRHLPRRGHYAMFDRSWYGRVLVERVEGFASEPDWGRAYGEINDFEEELCRAGVVVIKLWLQVSKDEQYRRFIEREQTGFKHFKLTQEDWRNRDKWDLYARAACDMVDRTSTAIAPWTLVAAEDKYFARIQVLEAIVDRVDRAL